MGFEQYFSMQVSVDLLQHERHIPRNYKMVVKFAAYSHLFYRVLLNFYKLLPVKANMCNNRQPQG